MSKTQIRCNNPRKEHGKIFCALFINIPSKSAGFSPYFTAFLYDLEAGTGDD